MQGCRPPWNNLQRRGVHVDPICPLCDANKESTIHILFNCPCMQIVWLQSGLQLPLVFYDTPLQCFGLLLSTKPIELCVKYLSICYFIWYYHNQVIWKQKH